MKPITILMVCFFVTACANGGKTFTPPPRPPEKPPHTGTVDHKGFENKIESMRQKLNKARDAAETINILLEVL